MNEELAIRLVDGDNNTCMQVSTANMYTLSTHLGHFVPRPQDSCFRPGLSIKRCVPAHIKHSFSVTVTGRRLVCSSSLIELLLKHDKSQLKCGAGRHHRCQLRDATTSGGGGLTACVGECRCDGEDCSSLQVNIGMYKDEWNWSICEISLR